MKTRLAALAMVTVAALAGCSSSSATPTVDSVAQKIGCTDLKAADTTMYAAKAGVCTKGGSQVYIYTFATKDDQQKWVDTAKKVAGVSGVQQGDLWVAQTV